MIIQEADHPLVLFGKFEIRLPQVVTMRAVESTFTPNLSRSRDRIVQSSLEKDSMNGSVADRRDFLNLIVPQIPFNLVWSPMLATPQFEYEVHSWLRSLVESVGPSGFDA